MSEHTLFLLTIAAIGLGTLFFRGAFIIPQKAHHLSNRMESLLEFIPVSAMAALAFAHSFYIKSGGVYEISPERITAGLIAFGVAWFSKNMLLTFAVGMAAIWVLGLLS